MVALKRAGISPNVKAQLTSRFHRFHLDTSYNLSGSGHCKDAILTVTALPTAPR